jgi:hypothetical protein
MQSIISFFLATSFLILKHFSGPLEVQKYHPLTFRRPHTDIFNVNSNHNRPTTNANLPDKFTPFLK